MAREYELIYILNPTLGEEGLAALNEKIRQMVESKGTIVNVDEWGKKALAYEIDDQREGYYMLLTFSAESTVPREIERIMRITDGVMRYLVIRKEQ